MAEVERVGLILVHGIGEQKRFAHLDSEIRNITGGLKRRPGVDLTVEILEGNAAAYQAEQDTWASGPIPSVRLSVEQNGCRLEINVHEVWWADVNEPYSLAKQIRFWLWGLSMWAFPKSLNRPDLPSFNNAMVTPSTPGNTLLKRVFTRLQLYLAGLFFLIAAFSLGAAIFLAKRLFDFEAPNFVRVFVNYISGVKLYNQRTRQGGGFLPNSQDFLDTLDDPPRVSIRRRMIQSIADVALNDYDRWYILAHSLGSVVAFNGIMEDGQAFANYLTREKWAELAQAEMAGPQRADDYVRNPPGQMSPSRPIWLEDTDLVYRDKIFAKFRGLLTYGSPLGKFVQLWPARVPVNKREFIFQPETEWINVFDGRDPVGGPMKAFNPDRRRQKGHHHHEHCPSKQNFPYVASSVLLLSHIRYLSVRDSEIDEQLSDVVARWLISGNSFSPPENRGRRHEMPTYWRRVYVSWVWWIVAFLVLAILRHHKFHGARRSIFLASSPKDPTRFTSFITWLGG